MSNRALSISGLITLFLLFTTAPASAQVDEDQLGAWYMYFWNTQFDDSRWGLQGDVQHRNWDTIGDLEQLLVRGGLTYRPESFNATFTLGVANITSGAFGDNDDTSNENRLYQEALVPHRLMDWIYVRHRFRTEQRWVDNQDFRTRFRYALFADIPLNTTDIGPGTWYAALYNEVFLNGEKDIGNGRRVDTLDRNRFYTGLGYTLQNNMRLQFGYMYQNTDPVDKGQLQFSLHHSF
ncbi:MAG: DUF2490 domain-containing protein [Gammaproteobacteria bacterium]